MHGTVRMRLKHQRSSRETGAADTRRILQFIPGIKMPLLHCIEKNRFDRKEAI